jgi:chemotaxis protein methyltransferase CheR
LTLQRLVHDLGGIYLGPHKRELAAARVFERLRALGLSSFQDYLPRVSGPAADAEEQAALVSSFASSRNQFFRDWQQLRFVETAVLQVLRERRAAGAPAPARVWSAGCATGEEPYSIAMILLEALGGGEVPVSILANDIDADALAIAASGVYPDAKLATVPAALRAKYLVGGAGTWRVRDEVRRLVSFQRFDLMSSPWPVRGSFDAIFCRNVLSWFDRPIQVRLVRSLVSHLAAGAHLFVGHSEALLDGDHDLVAVAPTVYAARAPLPPVHRVGVGDVFATAEPARIACVVDAAVAVCLFDPVARVGGMSQVFEPRAASAGGPGERGIPLLIERMLALGARRGRMVARLAGAASLVRTPDGPPQANLRRVRELLAAANIAIVEERVGGARPLEAHFATDTGRLRCRELSGL